MARSQPLRGARIAITRPAGTGTATARSVRGLGGIPILLPGSSLRAASDAAAARRALKAALHCDVVIFTSPAAVRFAQRLAPLRSRAQVLAPGAGTRSALQREGLAGARAPAREDSEGMLALDALNEVQGRRIGIVGAAGGRGLLTRELGTRGAVVMHAHVYQRLPARLDRRHAAALTRGDRHQRLYVLLSSAEALANILGGLPREARRVLLAGTAVVSSARLAKIARTSGFVRVLRGASAHADVMVAAVVADPNLGTEESLRPPP